MKFRYTVDVEVERTEGLFATRDELAEQIEDALATADPQSLSGDGGGEYETVDWTIEEVDLKAKR